MKELPQLFIEHLEVIMIVCISVNILINVLLILVLDGACSIQVSLLVVLLYQILLI